ncbi:MAG: DUF4430 domain-containing protein [Candidatus Buchananbacteria bacterium]|nr:DUF4430 domain-containing protein [Candidatus Buchananbacteria bacterium]
MKLIVRAVIIVAIFIAGFFVGNQYQTIFDSSVKQTENQSTAINVMIDSGKEIKLYERVSIAENETVFELLKKIADENNLELGYKDFGGELGVMIESIGGVKNDVSSNGFWQYWVNNSYAQVGPSSYRIHAGDSITWKYVTNQF